MKRHCCTSQGRHKPVKADLWLYHIALPKMHQLSPNIFTLHPSPSCAQSARTVLSEASNYHSSEETSPFGCMVFDTDNLIFRDLRDMSR